jgi:hypothetical protein
MITEMLIRHCEDLFGAGVTQLLGEDTRSDSGAEESTDSLHCKYYNIGVRKNVKMLL